MSEIFGVIIPFISEMFAEIIISVVVAVLGFIFRYKFKRNKAESKSGLQMSSTGNSTITNELNNVKIGGDFVGGNGYQNRSMEIFVSGSCSRIKLEVCKCAPRTIKISGSSSRQTIPVPLGVEILVKMSGSNSVLYASKSLLPFIVASISGSNSEIKWT